MVVSTDTEAGTLASPTGSTLVTALGEITNISDQDYDGGGCEGTSETI